MVTDIQRARRKDPGDPEVCNLFPLHPLYSSAEEVERIKRECPRAEIGCVECKKILMKNLLAKLAPVQEKRCYYEEHSSLLQEIIENGNSRARGIASATMEQVRKHMKI